AIVQYIADRAPAAKLAPPQTSPDRYRLQEWLGFINSEVHKPFAPLFHPEFPEVIRTAARDSVTKRFPFIEEKLDGNPYLMGEQFSVADGYLFTILNWTNFVKLDLSPWPK